MTKHLVSFVVLALGMLFTLNAFAALPVTVTRTQSLSFGSVVPFSSAGTVTIAPSIGGTRTGSNVFLFTQGAGSSGMSAAFTVSGGTPSAVCNITIPSASLTGPGASMVSNFSSSPSGTITLDGSGGGTIYVGGTLSVGGSQTAGSYTQTFTITVDGCI